MNVYVFGRLEMDVCVWGLEIMSAIRVLLFLLGFVYY